MKIGDEILAIDKEIMNLSTKKYTGTVVITLNMSQGGITKMHLNYNREIKKKDLS